MASATLPVFWSPLLDGWYESPPRRCARLGRLVSNGSAAGLKGIQANDGVPDMFHGLGVQSDDPQAVTLALAFKDVALGQCVASDDPRLKEK